MYCNNPFYFTVSTKAKLDYLYIFVPNPVSPPHLLRVLELPPEAFIHSLGGFLRAAHHGLNVDLKAAIQKLVDLPIVIVIISETESERKGGGVRVNQPPIKWYK